MMRQIYFIYMQDAGYKMISVILLAIESVINVCLILTSLHLRHTEMQFYDMAILKLEKIAKGLCESSGKVDGFETEISMSGWMSLGSLLVMSAAIVIQQFFCTETTFESVYGPFFCTFITFLHFMQITVAAAAVSVICKHLNKKVRAD